MRAYELRGVRLEMKPLKPYRLRRWRAGGCNGAVRFFTCARPGRTGKEGSKNAYVSDKLVHRWVLGLPRPKTAIVSLLGSKPGGPSEFSFYSFWGGFDSASSHLGQLSFREWLHHWHQDLAIELREHPTWDYTPIPASKCELVASDIRTLATSGHTVVLVDSGGQQRSGQVCLFMSAVEDFG